MTDTPTLLAELERLMAEAEAALQAYRNCEDPERKLALRVASDEVDDDLAVEAVNALPTLISALRQSQESEARMRDALTLILPLAKGYAPEGQSAQAKRTCRSWIDAAEAALSTTPSMEPNDVG